MVAGAVPGSPLGGHPIRHPFGPETSSLANVSGAGVFWTLVHGLAHLAMYPIVAQDRWLQSKSPDSSPGLGAPGSTTPIGTNTKQIIPLAKEFVVKKSFEKAVSYVWDQLEKDYYCDHDDDSTLCSKSKGHRGSHRHGKHGRRRR